MNMLSLLRHQFITNIVHPMLTNTDQSANNNAYTNVYLVLHHFKARKQAYLTAFVEMRFICIAKEIAICINSDMFS